ncbi:MAG: lytic transglycosylase domain-containing protein [Nitrospira sp.]
MISTTLNQSHDRRRGDLSRNGAWLWRVGIRLLVSLLLVALAAPAVLADGELYGYVSSTGTVHVTNVPTDQRFGKLLLKPRYHTAVSDQELEEAVIRYACEYKLSPALLLAVMKAESSFDPTVISKAGAVGLMQLIPETAIRHGVRNLYDTRDNIGGGAKHLRYLLDRFHGNMRLALAAYNAGEKKVDRYRQIPPFKETQSYVKKVMGYYRDYRSQEPDFIIAASRAASR